MCALGTPTKKKNSRRNLWVCVCVRAYVRVSFVVKGVCSFTRGFRRAKDNSALNNPRKKTFPALGISSDVFHFRTRIITGATARDTFDMFYYLAPMVDDG